MTHSTGSGQDDDSEVPQLSISIVRGDPSAEEVAAVTAVLSAALEELADANARESVVTTSAWQRGQRNIRQPIHPGPGAWRSFG